MIIGKRASKLLLCSSSMSNVTNNILKKVSSIKSNKNEQPDAPKLKEVFDTIKAVNYRYDFPQGLTEEEKKAMKRYDIFKYNPSESDEPPHFVSYYLDPSLRNLKFLDVLLRVKALIDPTLSFRKSCREGICGCCAMNIDGRETLACITEVPMDNYNKHFIAPLTCMNAIKDLVVDMSHFYTQYRSIQPYLKRKTPKSPNRNEYYQSIEDRAKIDGLYECVLCLSCSSSCPSYWWRPNEYLGPAVLIQALRWLVDSRDEYTDERLEALGGDLKLSECFQLGVCSLACPKGLDPRAAIEHIDELYKEYVERKERRSSTVQI